jgi:hypothetical protein
VTQLDQEIDRLYGLPLDEFTRERNATASRLAKAGDAEGAAALKQLQKPTVPAWAVNQLARRRPDQVEEALAAGRDLRKAHRAALSGKGGDQIAESGRRERQAVSDLVRSAHALLEEVGRSASQQTLDKIGSTLHAAALDLEAGKLLEAGRLTTELEPSGFGPLLAAVPAQGAKTRQAPAPRRRKQAKEAQEAQQELKEARSEERELRRAAARAERAAEQAEREAEAARERAEAANSEADEAGSRVAELERRLASLRTS